MEQTALNDFGASENSVYFNCHTYDNALLASGSLLAVIDEVCSGESLNGMALIRPPGHHALKDRCMGFCFFNNVAIGARHAQQVYGLERIAIIDWDVHHGNGTAEIFEDDPNLSIIIQHTHCLYRHTLVSYLSSLVKISMKKSLQTIQILSLFFCLSSSHYCPDSRVLVQQQEISG
ncbi:unnamed protein product [Schistosoma curassoni]|uniref:histone deacetylase n=1 Tax=Schistosoma curassoni TaxID=6186 RepID=A0A183KY95_9TREM|nr:unnamed protein product [Schistosoma curassoni]